MAAWSLHAPADEIGEVCMAPLRCRFSPPLVLTALPCSPISLGSLVVWSGHSWHMYGEFHSETPQTFYVIPHVDWLTMRR